MKRLSCTALALVLPAMLIAQDAPKPTPIAIVPAPATTLPLKRDARPTQRAITADDLMSRLYVFADDSMMGREAGTKGNTMGTDYIAAQVQRMGLQPAGENGTFFQTLPLKSRTLDPMSSFIAGGASLAFGTEWLPNGTASVNKENIETIYGGMLGDSTQLTAEQAAGKLVVLGIPLSNPAINRALSPGDVAPSTAAAVALIVPAPVVPGLMGFLRSQAMFRDIGEASTTRLFVAAAAANKLFAKPMSELTLGAVGTTVSVNAIIAVAPIQYPARNVVALLPGSDPTLKTQYVAIGAHNDHIGLSAKPADHDSMRILTHLVRPGGAEDGAKRASAEEQALVNAELADWRKTHAARLDSIYNGADDDGSGSVSVLEIAEYMSSMKKKPKRSTLFVWHVGEEKGLWGSEYFTDHPTVPRDSIVAQLNMDMVGRGDAWDVTGATKDGAVLRGDPDYVQIVGSRRLSTGLGDLLEKVNKTGRHRLNFDYALDANGHPMNIYCRSDHYEYARYGIPVAFFTTGGHSDYHQLTDEPQYIDYAHMTRIAKFVADAALNIANAGPRLVVDKAKPDPKGNCQQ